VYEDISKEWSERSWWRSNKYLLPEYEESENQSDTAYSHYIDSFCVRNTKILSNLTHLSSEEIHNRFPYVAKYVDPDVWVHGIPQGEISVLRVVARRPLDSAY
jgi:hypothetical protein